jgi:hypothetical protein
MRRQLNSIALTAHRGLKNDVPIVKRANSRIFGGEKKQGSANCNKKYLSHNEWDLSKTS